MKIYYFYYCDSIESHRHLDYKTFSVSASKYSIASYRFIKFYSNLDVEYINYFRFYRVENLAGKTSLRSFKTPDLIHLSEVTTIHNNKEVH